MVSCFWDEEEGGVAWRDLNSIPFEVNSNLKNDGKEIMITLAVADWLNDW